MKLMDILSPIFKRSKNTELNNLTDALDNSLEQVAEDLSKLELEYVIGTSSGEWLEHWGSWFGVSRLLNEEDENYRNRIVATVTKPKCTIPALTDIIRAYYNDDELLVEILEPYKRVAKYNQSQYSGYYIIQDGVYFRHGVIDIWIDAEITPALVYLIHIAKSAGIRVYFSKSTNLLPEEAYEMNNHWASHKVESQLFTKYIEPVSTQESISETNIMPEDSYQEFSGTQTEINTDISYCQDLGEFIEPMQQYSDQCIFGANIFDLFLNPDIPLIDIENESLHDNLPVQEDIYNEFSLMERNIYLNVSAWDMIQPDRLDISLMDIETKYLYEMYPVYCSHDFEITTII